MGNGARRRITLAQNAEVKVPLYVVKRRTRTFT
jgi:hypothetical protein